MADIVDFFTKKVMNSKSTDNKDIHAVQRKMCVWYASRAENNAEAYYPLRIDELKTIIEYICDKELESGL